VASPSLGRGESCVSPWLILAPKLFQLCTNHFVLVLCKPMWVNKAFQFFLVPSRSSNTPFYPSKVLWARERASIPYYFTVFCLGLTFESFKELGVRQTKRTVLSGNQYSTLNGPNHLFLNLPICVFSPLETIRHNLQIETFFQYFFC